MTPGFEYAIVGGGIHGTHVAHRLVRDAGLDPEELVVLDARGEPLASFRERARACGMQALRSPTVHHLGTDPFGLKDFAEARDRTDELVPTRDRPRRPSLELFLDHAEHVIDSSGLADRLRETTVTDVERVRGGGLYLRTGHGPVRARRCVLAIGHGGRLRRPDWAVDLGSPSCVSHVWDEPASPGSYAEREHVCVVGGGITAGQLSLSLSGTPPVTLLARRELREASVEADPHWINWPHIEDHLHSLPAGSAARLERVAAKHEAGTIPPYLRRRMERAADRGGLEVRVGTIESARADWNGVVLRLEDGSVERFDRVLLATGFASSATCRLVERIAASLSLERGHRGVPVLDDASLEWRTVDGSRSGVFVTGTLGAATLGPFAGTIAGARRAADRLVETHERRARRSVPAD
jgi:glycine/D-amino acid oxidase-like deaminating enzyme